MPAYGDSYTSRVYLGTKVDFSVLERELLKVRNCLPSVQICSRNIRIKIHSSVLGSRETKLRTHTPIQAAFAWSLMLLSRDRAPPADLRWSRILGLIWTTFVRLNRLKESTIRSRLPRSPIGKYLVSRKSRTAKDGVEQGIAGETKRTRVNRPGTTAVRVQTGLTDLPDVHFPVSESATTQCH
jgi:hypothetical protein